MISVIELAEAIKQTGRRSTQDLPPLLAQAKELAEDRDLDGLSRALAFRAAGNAEQMMNRFDPALSSYDRAISILETEHNPQELGRTLHAKVGLLNFMGKFEELLTCSDRARRIFEELGETHRLARLDANLSHAYHRLGRFDMVFHFSERALPVLEEVQDHEGYMVALTNSAVALMVRHDFEECGRRYRKALELALSKGWNVWALHCTYNIAYLSYLLGDSSDALAQIGSLRTRYLELGDERQVCQCFLNEAEILIEIGDLEKAFRAASEAHTLGQRLGLDLETGKSLLFQAIIRSRLNSADEVRELLSEAARCFRKQGNNLWASIAVLQTALIRGEAGDQEALSDALATQSFLKNTGLPDRSALADIVIGRLHRASGNLSDAIARFRSALETASRGRSNWMQFHAAHELGRSLASIDTHESSRHLRTAEQMLDSLWNKIGSDDLKLAFLHDRESVYTHLVRQTLNESPEAAFEFSEKARSRVLRERLVEGSAGTTTLASSLSEDEVLLEYFIDADDLLIFTLSRDHLACSVQRGAVSGLRNHLSNFQRHISSCSVAWEQLLPARRHLALTAQSHLGALHVALIEPVREHLRRRVIVVPHGFLHEVPFHSLWDGRSFLMENHEVLYSPSAALYCAPAAPPESDSAVFVAFSAEKATTAVEEVRQAAARFPHATVLIDPTPAEMVETFRQPHALVHIAGHAGIDAIGGQLAWVETPHGRLTHHDLGNMAIRARTIVITGCQTARRMIGPGDEWQGLMRAFYLAGASTIVSALWDVRDESARQFATEFYKCFSGDNAPGAVQYAIQAVRRSQDHPYFWGGFTAFVRSDVRRPS